MNRKDLLKRAALLILAVMAILVICKLVMFLLVAMGWSPGGGSSEFNG
jgi:hypothetical protein